MTIAVDSQIPTLWRYLTIEIPHTELSEDALLGVIQEFILREGTDYGHASFSLQEKIEQVKRQLLSGEVRLTYDPDTESCNLVRAD